MFLFMKAERTSLKTMRLNLRMYVFPMMGKTDVLQGVNLKIKDGERMALVGQSGAGKSTVIELISRFYECRRGGADWRYQCE